MLLIGRSEEIGPKLKKKKNTRHFTSKVRTIFQLTRVRVKKLQVFQVLQATTVFYKRYHLPLQVGNFRYFLVHEYGSTIAFFKITYTLK